MYMEYTVKKNPKTRIAYRIFGIILMIIPFTYFTLMFTYNKKPILILSFLFAFFFAYGLYLAKMSFRKQAYDIGYKFMDNIFYIKCKNKETEFTYKDVDFITMVIPDESLIYYLLNLSVKGEIYIIPFTNKKEKCETLYEYIKQQSQ